MPNNNLKIGHWWYGNLYIFVVIFDAILDFHMKYQIYTILEVSYIFIGRKSQMIDSKIIQIEQQVHELWLSKKPKNQGAITLQKMNFLEKICFLFFHFLNINPDARYDSSIIFRFSTILHQNYREYIRENRKRGITQ